MNFINFSCINTPGGGNVLGIGREQKCPNTPSLYTTYLNKRVIMYAHNSIKYFTHMMEKRKGALQS